MKIYAAEPRVKSYLDELNYAKSLSEIRDFEALVKFLRIPHWEVIGE